MINASGHHLKYLDGGIAVPLPDQDYLPDVFTSSSARPSDQNTPHQQLTEPWSSKPLLNPKKSFQFSEYQLLKLNKT